MKKFLFYLQGLSIVAALSISTTFAYTQEEREAYQRAHEYGIVSANTIDSANLNWAVTKQALSKMIITYIENTEWIKNTTKICSFPDEESITPSLKSPAKKMCSYNLMWTNWQNFSPTAPVSNAQLWTVLSRVLWGDKYNVSGKWYYIYHLNALKKAWIMDNIDDPLQTIATRWEVLVMLKRINNQDYEEASTGTIAKPANTVKSSKNTISCKDVNWELIVDTDTLDWSFTYADSSLCAYYKWKYFCSDTNKHITYPTVSTTEPAYTCKDSKWQLSVFANGWYSYVKWNFGNAQNSQKATKENSNKISSNSNTSNKTNWSSIWEDIIAAAYENSNVIYTENGKKYYYDWEFLALLRDKAKKKWESDLYKYLVVETQYFNDNLNAIANMDEDFITKKLGIDLDTLDSGELSHKEKEKLVSNYKKWLDSLLQEYTEMYDTYLNSIKKLTNNITDDKFWLKEKYKETESFLNASKEYLGYTFKTLNSMIDAALAIDAAEDEAAAEEIAQQISEEQLGNMFWLLAISIAYQAESQEYTNYLDNWGINTINILD